MKIQVRKTVSGDTFIQIKCLIIDRKNVITDIYFPSDCPSDKAAKRHSLPIYKKSGTDTTDAAHIPDPDFHTSIK